MPKQEFLPGTAPKRVRSLIAAAEKLIEAKDEHKRAGEGKQAAEDELIAVMRKQGLDTYKYGGMTIDLEQKDKVSVHGRVAQEEPETGEEATA